MREEKGKCKIIIISVIISILLIGLVIFFWKDIVTFTKKGTEETNDLEELSIKTSEQLVGSEIMRNSSTVEHECRNYLESKYDKTNHWEECSICGTKYNQATHTYEEYWIMGESCHPSNKCIHTCSCGYTYQSDNTREHKSLGDFYTNKTEYSHRQKCFACDYMVINEICTREDGNQIDCKTKGTCIGCGQVYSQVGHLGSISEKNGNVECKYCGTYVGEVSNLVTTYPTSDTFEFSYDFSISDSGNFEGCSEWLGMTNSTKEYHRIEKTSSTSIHVTGKIKILNSKEEREFWTGSYIANYYFSADEFVGQNQVHLYAMLDREAPVINSNIVQANLATSNGWATQKQLTISGTENYCSSVKLTLKDSEGNIYLNNASTMVSDNAWSYTFIPNIEANEAGKEFTITATDNLGNSSEQKFMVYKTDKKAPTVTSASETSKTWTQTKNFTFTATDEGSGGVSIALNNTNDYVVAAKSGTTYSRNHSFTEEIYGNKSYTVYFKDGLGNTNTQTFKVYNIDNTPPTITGNSIVSKEIVLTGHDKNSSNVEGSGIAGYRYLGSSSESVSITENNSKLTTSNKIPLSEFERVKYGYIVAVDKAGNTSEMIKVVLPTYKIAVNPNGGTWRGSNTVTNLSGYQHGQEITIENPTRPGYEFAGWETSAGSMKNTTYTFTVSDATLQAQWNLISPTLENKIETSTHTVSTPLPVENDTGTATLTKEDGIVVYHIKYTSTIKNYIGKAKIEIVSTLPAEIDIDKSELAGGNYQKDTHTITWTEEIANIDTFANGNHTKEITKPIAVVYKNQNVTQDLINTVTGKTTTYYPEGYLDKGGQEFIKREKTVKATVKQDYKVNLKITAMWDDNKNQKEKRPEKVTIEIKKMPDDEIITKELAEENNWTYEEIGLQKYNTTGEKITYLVTQKETEEGDLEYYEEANIIETETQKEEVTNKTITITNEYKLMNTDLNTEITIKGTEEIQEKEQEIENTINLTAQISHYIGEGKIIITDTLPYNIDLEKSDIGNGIYDEERKTITWEEQLPHINTEKTKENYQIDTTKLIKLNYTDIDLTQEKLTNQIKAKIELYETEEKDEKTENFDTNINVLGKVVERYIDRDTREEIAESHEIIDKIGKDFHIEKKELKGYRYLQTELSEEGIIKEKPQEVIHYYEKLNFNIGIEKTIQSIYVNGENIKIIDNKQAQIEINKNNLDHTNLMLHFNIKVTNKGELAGTATIVEQVLAGYQLEELPAYWKRNEEGNLETEVELEAGESKDLSITQKWINNENNLGSKISTSKITSAENVVSYPDSNTEDNISTTTIIISTKEEKQEPDKEQNEKPNQGEDGEKNEELNQKPNQGTDKEPNEESNQKPEEKQKEELNQGLDKEKNKVLETIKQQNKIEPEKETTKKGVIVVDNLYTGDEIGFIVIVAIVLIGINLVYFVVKMKRLKQEGIGKRRMLFAVIVSFMLLIIVMWLAKIK